ncbi:uncharacterized protein LOC142024644 [Carettochelys insculpta]|uniref:uncharacterized protein LOC142024644 n=1 Tax=Carettochelys insculpta TaxID=44489 RepID=UPI003EC01416
MAFLTPDLQRGIAKGLEHLVSLARNMSSSSETPGVHRRVQEDARSALKEMTAVNSQLEKQQRTMDSQAVEVAEKSSTLRKEKHERELSQDLSRIELQYHESTKEHAETIHGTAKSQLEELTKMQKKARREVGWNKIARNIALAFLPFSSLMAGIMTAVFQASLYTAQRAEQELQTAVDFYKTKVCEYEQNIRKCDLEKEKTEQSVKADETRIREIEEELSRLQANWSEEQDLFLCFLGLLLTELQALPRQLEEEGCWEDAWTTLETVAVEKLEGGEGLLSFWADTTRDNGKKIQDLVRELGEILHSRAKGARIAQS